MGKRARDSVGSAAPSSVVKPKSKKHRRQSIVGSAEAAEWQPVHADEEFHTGLDEDGFMGLEVLEAPKMFGSSKQPAAGAWPAATDDVADGAAAEPTATPGKKACKKAKLAEQAAGASSDGKLKKQKEKKQNKGAKQQPVDAPAATPQPELPTSRAAAAGAAAEPPGEAPPAAAAAGPAFAAGARAARNAAAADGDGGIEDEVAAALRARAAQKKEAVLEAQKRKKEVLLPLALLGCCR